GRDRAGPAARAGDRTDRPLLEPGALRQADDAPVGPQDRPRPPAAAVLRQGDLPSDVPLRADLGRRRRADPAVRREALPAAAAVALCALRLVLLLRPLLR